MRRNIHQRNNAGSPIWDKVNESRSHIELSSDLPRFIHHVEPHPLNGIVGNICNFFDLDASLLMERMVRVAREDLQQLIGA